MEDEGLPCLERLDSTPDILRGLKSELTEEDARWKPAEGRVSIAEALAHLLDLYRDANPEDAFDQFEEQRESNVEYLRALPASAGDRRAIHKEYGEITLSQILHEWALHDLGHVRQIAEPVRARTYLGGAGPMGRGYQLRP